MTPDQRKRLTQLLGMLGSAHDGEVLNAAKMAQRFLGGLGLSWEEALNHAEGIGYTEDQMRAAFEGGHSSGYAKGYAEAKADGGGGIRPFVSWRAVAQDLLDNHHGLLTEWEVGFMESYVERRWGTPTEKQRGIFERVADKTGVTLPP